MGGGAGKAICGMALLQAPDNNVSILLLEKPDDLKYLNLLKKENMSVYVEEKADIVKRLIEESDIVIFNWWAHPLATKFLYEYPKVKSRMIIWNHVNGCTYPYLPFVFLDKFHAVAFTSEFSYENHLWTRSQKHRIWGKSDLILGMGNFKPKDIAHKIDYSNREDFVVGYVGTVNYGKMSNQYIDYCKKAAELIPNIRFVIVGEPDKKVISDIEKSGIADKFKLTGKVNDTAPYYRSFDVLGYILNEDSYATTENVLLEAMAFGLPIVVKNNNVEMRIIKDGINGYVISNVDEYADELYYLYNHPDIRKDIGAKEYDYVLEYYSCIDNYKRFERLIDKVIEQPRKIFEFKDVIGVTPYEWFMTFTGDDKDFFEQVTNYPDNEYVNCKAIYKERKKSSIRHFLDYFYDDVKLNLLCQKCICGSEDE